MIKSTLNIKDECKSPIFIYADNLSQKRTLICFDEYIIKVECYIDKVVIMSGNHLMEELFFIDRDTKTTTIHTHSHIGCYFNIIDKIIHHLNDDNITRLYGAFSSEFFYATQPNDNDLLAIFYVPEIVYKKINMVVSNSSNGIHSNIELSILDKYADILNSDDKLKMINPSIRIDINSQRKMIDIFKRLYLSNPSKNQLFLKHKDICFTGSSPCETFYLYGEELHITSTCGTAPKLQNEPEINLKNLILLLNSNKEDGDLTKCRTKDIMLLKALCDGCFVGNYKIIDEYSNVFHTSSIIKGKTKSGVQIKDIIQALAFPATITGVPEKKALEIISNFENRGFYGGSFGYISKKTSRLSLIIRCLFKDNNSTYTRVGTSLSVNSDLAFEKKEILAKANLILGMI